MRDRELHGLRGPSPGERAVGHGVDGVVTTVLLDQPLAGDGVWRVVLAGESFGRIVCGTPDDGWHLLQFDELTDAQLDVLDGVATAPSLG